MIASRPWLALVVALFCLPLFVGLGRLDLENDEAIYSFAVDRILETGDWLEPKSSPNEDYAFLEKPPLKFWIVAAPIKAGLLPHNGFGLRFFDALFGAAAFVYVFAIGCRLIGPACGAVAVLLLFVHWPLLFDHGLRTNNMESALLLSYCGGVYHFLEWVRNTPDPKVGPTGATGWGAARSGARGHAVAVGLCFVLGFMTKFVAVAFLPLVLGVASLIAPDLRRKVVRAWRVWAAVGVLVVALSAPWFVWAHVTYGAFFWEKMMSEAVLRRFTAFLNPVHVQPWHFYVLNMYQRFGDTQSSGLVVGGLLALIIQTIRRRSADGLVVVLWFALPVILISFGTSKLYHYVYPFLPPLALAAGYLAALVWMLAPAPLGRALKAAYDSLTARVPALITMGHRPIVRATLLTIAALAALVAAVSLVYGPIRIDIGRTMLFKNSGVIRPSAVILLFGVLAGASRRASRLVVVLLVGGALPLQGYRETLPRLMANQHPMRAAAECLVRVQSQVRGLAPGLYLDLSDELISHPLYYYFRRVRPWTRARSPDPGAIGRSLDDPAQWRPMLVRDSTYQDFMNAQTSRPASPPMVALPDVVLLLPGPYAVCGEVQRTARFSEPRGSPNRRIVEP